MAGAEPRLIFDVPGGRLSFPAGALDVWAEHLAWSYELMGVERGATIAVQDFGASPLSFLGSALLMPGLKRGLAERMDGRFICLDASPERVTLTAAVLAQLAVDALVVRADVAGLLAAELGKKTRNHSGLANLRIIVAFGGEDPPPARVGSSPWRYLLHAASSLLLAPECRSCGCFHLRAGFYDTDGTSVWNLRHAEARPFYPRAATLMPARGCALGPDDFRLRYAGETEGV